MGSQNLAKFRTALKLLVGTEEYKKLYIEVRRRAHDYVIKVSDLTSEEAAGLADVMTAEGMPTTWYPGMASYPHQYKYKAFTLPKT